MKRNCPICNREVIYKTKVGYLRAEKTKTCCNNCKAVLNNDNVIDNINSDNYKSFTAGQIIRYIYTFNHTEWNVKTLEILKLFNPQIDYKIIGRITAREKNIQYRCTKHPREWVNTDFRHIIERQTGCAMCKGQNFTNTWTDDFLYESMKNMLINVFNETGCVFSLSSYKQWDSKIVNAWRSNIENPSEMFYKLINELNLPNPSNGSYIKDDKLFRGFNEFVGYCLITKWGIPFQYSPKVFDNYYSDGFFTEINTHWEHWGELNKNNNSKRELYLKSDYKLFETYDNVCNKKGITYIYNEIRNFLISNGYNIPTMSHQEILNTIKGNNSTFEVDTDKILKIVKEFNWTEKIVEHDLRPTYEGNVVLSYINKYFDGSILKFKKYFNENFNFNYKIKAFRHSYKNHEYFVSNIKPFIIEFGCIPKQQYFIDIKRNDIVKIVNRLCGGFNNLKRNEIEEGIYFHLVKHLYPNNSAPYDKEFIWKDDNYNENTIKIIKYYSSIGFEFPKNMNTLRFDKNFFKFGPSLHSAISRNGGWGEFIKKYKSIW